MRADGRSNDQKRTMKITPGVLPNAAGSVLVETGNTRVLCSCMLEERTAPFLTGTGKGWLTAEYAMLPASTPVRKARERGKPDGRSTEIQRLIGRALRTAVDLESLGERSIYIDCDVISADGGTRTASICGGYAALALAVNGWLEKGVLAANPLRDGVAAVSVGIVEEEALLDLCYTEDSHAQVDMNVVMTHSGKFVEIQGTGEERAFSEEELSSLLALAKKGIGEIISLQKQTIGE